MLMKHYDYKEIYSRLRFRSKKTERKARGLYEATYDLYTTDGDYSREFIHIYRTDIVEHSTTLLIDGEIYVHNSSRIEVEEFYVFIYILDNGWEDQQ